MPYKDPTSLASIDAARTARRKHYHANKERYLENNRKKRAAMRAHVNALKSAPCTDCGQCYPYYVMQFDHITGTKVGGINTLVQHGSWQKLYDEIAKCEVVCANCHSERTHQRGEAKG